MTKGISVTGFSGRYGTDIMAKYKDIMEKYIHMGLLEKDGDFIRFTERGRDVSNTVLCEFL